MSGGVASGVGWSALAQSARMLVQLLGLMVLARLLPAADFGLVALAAVAVGFAGLFRDMGTAAAIVRWPELSDELLDSVFWLNTVLGMGLALLFWAGAPLVAWSFGEPRLSGVLRALALVFPLGGLAAVHQALLERSSRFRALALVETAAAFGGLVLAVVLARLGWGVYSLVGQTVGTSLLAMAGLWAASTWRPAWRFSRATVAALSGFSGNLIGYNTFNYFVRNVDNVLIGRFLGPVELGYYSMAYKLMLWPLQNVSGVVGRALFPALARSRDDAAVRAAVYLRWSQLVVLATAPLMCGLFVLREPFVQATLGPQWHAVADVLFWLAPVGLLQSVGALVGSLYLASGRTDLMFRWGVAAGLAAAAAFAVGLQWGLEGVAAAYLLFSVLAFLPNLAIPFRVAGMDVAPLLLRIAPATAAAAAMACVVAGVAQLPAVAAAPPAWRLGGLAGIGALVYAVLVLLLPRSWTGLPGRRVPEGAANA